MRGRNGAISFAAGAFAVETIGEVIAFFLDLGSDHFDVVLGSIAGVRVGAANGNQFNRLAFVLADKVDDTVFVLNDGWAVVGQEGDDNDVLLDIAKIQGGVFTLGVDGWNAGENRGFVANFDFVGGKGWERHG